jgi:type I restriction enzyme R subunit
MNEADTCRLLVEPKLRDAGWETPPYSVLSQPIIAPGRIVPRGRKAKRQDPQRPDYLLRYAPHLTVAVVEAKRDTRLAKVDAVTRLQAETQAELDALLPAVLDRAFKGEL